jgi:glycosyltransferase involved in cell wall biosynthesis
VASGAGKEPRHLLGSAASAGVATPKVTEVVAAALPFSLIIPAYNEEGAILSVLERVHESLGTKTDYELIVVNDGSKDATGVILDDAVAALPNVRVFHHDRNLGYGAALKTGIRRASHPLIVITDADGTYPLNRILDLLAIQQRTGAEMVVGARIGEDVEYPLLRKIPKLFLRAYSSWLARARIPDMNSGFRVFLRDSALRYMRLLPNGFSFTTTITIALHADHRYVVYEPISYAKRVGRSKIRPIRDTLNFLQLIARTGMYFAPLRVLLPVAGALGVASLVSFAYDLWNRDLTEKTLLLFLFTLNTLMFALLADMLDRRSTK